MKPILTPLSLLLTLGASLSLAQDTAPAKDVRLNWQDDIIAFATELDKLSRETRVPAIAIYEKRLKEQAEDVAVITDGAGGVVDFDARKGSPQFEASKRFSNKPIEWDIELLADAELLWGKSLSLAPTLPPAFTVKLGEEEGPLFTIWIQQPSQGPFEAGERVKLRATIDDFSRFRKDFSKAYGVVAFYHFDGHPGPFFTLKLDEATITPVKLVKDASQNDAPTTP